MVGILVEAILALIIAVLTLLLFVTARARERRPTAPALPPVGPQWAPDPFGKHEYRFWNGTRWTIQVSDDGVVGHDQ
jgi:hypothetical protein